MGLSQRMLIGLLSWCIESSKVKAPTFLKYVHTYSRLRSSYDFSLSNLIQSCGTWSPCPDWLPIIGARALYDAKKVCSGKVSLSLLCMVIMGILRLLHLWWFLLEALCFTLFGIEFLGQWGGSCIFKITYKVICKLDLWNFKQNCWHKVIDDKHTDGHSSKVISSIEVTVIKVKVTSKVTQ